jgi:hypothetical protein
VNFRLLGDCLLWAVLLENTEVAVIFGQHYPNAHAMIFFDKIWVGNILGDFFTSSSGHPGNQRHVQILQTLVGFLFNELGRNYLLTHESTLRSSIGWDWQTG